MQNIMKGKNVLLVSTESAVFVQPVNTVTHKQVKYDNCASLSSINLLSLLFR